MKMVSLVLVAVLFLLAAPAFAKVNTSPSLSTRPSPEFPPITVGPMAYLAAQAMDCAFADMLRTHKQEPTPETREELGIVLREVVTSFRVWTSVAEEVPNVSIQSGYPIIILFESGVCGKVHHPAELEDVLRLSFPGLDGAAYPAWGHTLHNGQLIFIVWMGKSREGRPMFVFFSIDVSNEEEGIAKKESEGR